jgi:hypothetical protein
VAAAGAIVVGFGIVAGMGVVGIGVVEFENAAEMGVGCGVCAAAKAEALASSPIGRGS